MECSSWNEARAPGRAELAAAAGRSLWRRHWKCHRYRQQEGDSFATWTALVEKLVTSRFANSDWSAATAQPFEHHRGRAERYKALWPQWPWGRRFPASGQTLTERYLGRHR